MTNPISYQPTAAFTFTTYTSDNYTYATDNSTIKVTNSLPSAFGSVNYTFSSTTYNTTSNLVLNVDNLNSLTNSYVLSSFEQFVNTSISNLVCNSTIDITCVVNGS